MWQSTSENEPILSVRDFSFTYGQTNVPTVHGVTVSVDPGERVGIVGESGSGKTTLIRSILGLVRGRASGKIDFDGREILGNNGRASWSKSIRARTGFVSQNPDTALRTDWTVREIWNEPWRIHDHPAGKSRDSRIRDLAAFLDLPQEITDRRVETLSGGQKQRIAIGRALILEPEIVFLDEPFSALDVLVQAGIINVLGDRAHFQHAMMLVSHDLALVSFLCDRVHVMLDGAVVESGPVEDVFGSPRHPHTAALVAAVRTGEAC